MLEGWEGGDKAMGLVWRSFLQSFSLCSLGSESGHLPHPHTYYSSLPGSPLKLWNRFLGFLLQTTAHCSDQAQISAKEPPGGPIPSVRYTLGFWLGYLCTLVKPRANTHKGLGGEVVKDEVEVQGEYKCRWETAKLIISVSSKKPREWRVIL